MNSRFFTFLTIFICLINCKEKKTEDEIAKISQNENIISSSKIQYGKNFFEYDEIDFYSTQISENDAMDLLEEKKIDYEVIMDAEFPKSIKENKFVKMLPQIGFKKSKVKTEDFAEIDKIFIEKSERDGIDFACIPVFRDILIFKKNNKNIGIVKICFDCSQYHIVGTTANTDNFGQGDDYEKLGKILDKY